MANETKKSSEQLRTVLTPSTRENVETEETLSPKGNAMQPSNSNETANTNENTQRDTITSGNRNVKREIILRSNEGHQIIPSNVKTETQSSCNYDKTENKENEEAEILPSVQAVANNPTPSTNRSECAKNKGKKRPSQIIAQANRDQEVPSASSSHTIENTPLTVNNEISSTSRNVDTEKICPLQSNTQVTILNKIRSIGRLGNTSRAIKFDTETPQNNGSEDEETKIIPKASTAIIIDCELPSISRNYNIENNNNNSIIIKNEISSTSGDHISRDKGKRIIRNSNNQVNMDYEIPSTSRGDNIEHDSNNNNSRITDKAPSNSIGHDSNDRWNKIVSDSNTQVNRDYEVPSINRDSNIENNNNSRMIDNEMPSTSRDHNINNNDNLRIIANETPSIIRDHNSNNREKKIISNTQINRDYEVSSTSRSYSIENNNNNLRIIDTKRPPTSIDPYSNDRGEKTEENNSRIIDNEISSTSRTSNAENNKYNEISSTSKSYNKNKGKRIIRNPNTHVNIDYQIPSTSRSYNTEDNLTIIDNTPSTSRRYNAEHNLRIIEYDIPSTSRSDNAETNLTMINNETSRSFNTKNNLRVIGHNIPSTIRRYDMVNNKNCNLRTINNEIPSTNITYSTDQEKMIIPYNPRTQVNVDDQVLSTIRPLRIIDNEIPSTSGSYNTEDSLKMIDHNIPSNSRSDNTENNAQVNIEYLVPSTSSNLKTIAIETESTRRRYNTEGMPSTSTSDSTENNNNIMITIDNKMPTKSSGYNKDKGKRIIRNPSAQVNIDYQAPSTSRIYNTESDNDNLRITHSEIFRASGNYKAENNNNIRFIDNVGPSTSRNCQVKRPIQSSSVQVNLDNQRPSTSRDDSPVIKRRKISDGEMQVASGMPSIIRDCAYNREPRDHHKIVVNSDLPEHLLTIAFAANIAGEEADRLHSPEKRTEADILNAAIPLELSERKRFKRLHGLYPQGATQALEVFIEELLSESLRFKMYYNLTRELFYDRKYRGYRDAIQKMIYAIEMLTDSQDHYSARVEPSSGSSTDSADSGDGD